MHVTLSQTVFMMKDHVRSYPSWAYLVCPGHLTDIHVGNVDNSDSQIE